MYKDVSYLNHSPSLYIKVDANNIYYKKHEYSFLFLDIIIYKYWITRSKFSTFKASWELLNCHSGKVLHD